MWANVPKNYAFSDFKSARDLVSVRLWWWLVWCLGDPWWVIWVLDIHHMCITCVVAFSLTLCNVDLFLCVIDCDLFLWKLQGLRWVHSPIFLLCFKLGMGMMLVLNVLSYCDYVWFERAWTYNVIVCMLYVWWLLCCDDYMLWIIGNYQACIISDIIGRMLILLLAHAT
jgi:hypothetical protein